MFSDLAAELLDGRRLSTRAFPTPLDAGTLVAGIQARLPELREVVAIGVSYGDLARAIGDCHVASRMGADVDGRAVAAIVGAILIMEHDTTAEAPRTQAAAQAAGRDRVVSMVANTDALPPGAMRDAMQAYIMGDTACAETKLAIALRFCGSDLVASFDGCIAFLVQMRGLLFATWEAEPSVLGHGGPSPPRSPPPMDDSEVDAWLRAPPPALPGALPVSFWGRLHHAAEHPFDDREQPATMHIAEPLADSVESEPEELPCEFDPWGDNMWAESFDPMDELARILNMV
jgi:hypothetical protein